MFEQEYRTHKLFHVENATDEDRTIKLPKIAIREVILGALMPEKESIEVRDLINAQLPHVTIKQAVSNADDSITIN